jgi:hypothetical protein
MPIISGARSRAQTARYWIADLAAGADITATPIFCAPSGGATITDIGIVPLGATAGVDNSNTAVFAITDKDGNSIVSKTYNTANQPPAVGVYGSLGALSAHAVLTANEVVQLALTQGATADLPAVMLQIEYTGSTA